MPYSVFPRAICAGSPGGRCCPGTNPPAAASALCRRRPLRREHRHGKCQYEQSCACLDPHPLHLTVIYALYVYFGRSRINSPRDCETMLAIWRFCKRIGRDVCAQFREENSSGKQRLTPPSPESCPRAARNLAANPLGMPIGCQTYPVRAAIGQDFPGTIKQLADAGFQTIELCSPVGYARFRFRRPRQIQRRRAAQNSWRSRRQVRKFALRHEGTPRRISPAGSPGRKMSA